MQSAVQALILRWRERGYVIGFGVGIATGTATVGRIGYEGRIDYTAIGSVVNLASRNLLGRQRRPSADRSGDGGGCDRDDRRRGPWNPANEGLRPIGADLCCEVCNRTSDGVIGA
jgi:hypothetical protein